MTEEVQHLFQWQSGENDAKRRTGGGQLWRSRWCGQREDGRYRRHVHLDDTVFLGVSSAFIPRWLPLWHVDTGLQAHPMLHYSRFADCWAPAPSLPAILVGVIGTY